MIMSAKDFTALREYIHQAISDMEEENLNAATAMLLEARAIVDYVFMGKGGK